MYVRTYVLSVCTYVCMDVCMHVLCIYIYKNVCKYYHDLTAAFPANAANPMIYFYIGGAASAHEKDSILVWLTVVHGCSSTDLNLSVVAEISGVGLAEMGDVVLKSLHAVGRCHTFAGTLPGCAGNQP